ncbi:hypothetical protein PR048_010191 [Dryococelus australis]|uniref:Uncharacterized protein n=1 Tax=Dryococelus australis TaxID=614101 RepID=A0ABQ9I242_9NEOP|nr:hypothetical protein PR048_010191 [Dryococelus australis]
MSSNPQSVLDVVLNSASVAGRKTYLHRMVYIGEHNLPLQGKDNIFNVFEHNIWKINEGCRDEILTGFLLVYSTHFAHILEVS